MVTIAGGGGAPEMTTNSIASVIQTVLAAQLVAKGNLLDGADSGSDDSARRIPVPVHGRTGGPCCRCVRTWAPDSRFTDPVRLSPLRYRSRK